MKKRSTVTYLVSGDDNITACEQVLRDSGRTVRHDSAVDAKAAVAMRAGKRYVVVAHGMSDGTVMWFRSDSGISSKWLWVGMKNPPRKSRIYLYACRAGKELPSYLKHCECFGHAADVPMPLGNAEEVVLGYLDRVDDVMRNAKYDPVAWRDVLGGYVNDALVEEAENPRGFTTAFYLHMLRKSLGYFDG